jgi:hypothetical protein
MEASWEGHWFGSRSVRMAKAQGEKARRDGDVMTTLSRVYAGSLMQLQLLFDLLLYLSLVQ